MNDQTRVRTDRYPKIDEERPASGHSQSFIQRLFEAQVATTPDAVALLHQGESFTYAQLNAAANQLARLLIAGGVGPDQLVGVCLERSCAMVVALLGILKAGGAYLPLDPNYPAERLQYMVADAAPTVVLTNTRLRHLLPGSSVSVVDVEHARSQLVRFPSNDVTDLETSLNSENLAYVIYTSGSTGRPKGTAMPHRALVNLLRWHAQELPSTASSRVLQFAALSFDVAFQEIFSTLTTGGTVVLIDEWLRRDTRALLEFIHGHNIERLFIPPLMLQSLAGSFQKTQLELSLRDVIVAGEQLRITPEIVQLFVSLGRCRLHNHYGPTETHVVTALTLAGDPTEWPALPPIGRPISNVSIYVLDPQGQPLRAGESGEIYIGGASVARGYLHRPELTAQRFQRDPFDSGSHAAMYRTGDLGRVLDTGSIEYLGRNDDQVKIRGFRVELGEIEAQLTKHVDVGQAVVAVREDTKRDRRLVAYFTAREQHVPTADQLRRHLRAVLPQHMVPSAFVHMAQLPLSPNGKLDRGALPTPQFSAYSARGYEPVQGEIEGVLARIWQALLPVERVGRRDNFFELGGHSLLIGSLLDRLGEAGFSASAQQIFESENLAEMAALLSRQPAEAVVPPNLIPAGCTEITPQMLPLVDLDADQIARIVAAVPGGASNIQDIYPLAPLQEGILFHHLLDDARGDTYVLPTLLEVESKQRLQDLIAALQAAIDRHDVLRTQILWEELPRAVQVVLRTASLPVEQVVLGTGVSVDTQITNWMQTEQQRLDIRQAPLVRLRVAVDDDSGCCYVLLQLHHITVDHVAFEAVIDEVVEQMQGHAHRWLPPVPYREHVATALMRARTNDDEQFFRAKLSDVDEPSAAFGLLDVRGDGARIKEAREALTDELSERIREQARRAGVSSATLFHAACALVVANTSGRDDVVIGTLLLGRLRSAAISTLGMFINTLPLRLVLKDLSALDLVQHTQRELAELLGHEQASLALAQRCSALTGDVPLFNTLLNYVHGEPDPLAKWEQASGIKGRRFQELTNYPITLLVHDLGAGFTITAQTERRVDPARTLSYLRTAVEELVSALEQASQAPALSLRILPDAELHQVVEQFNPTAPATASEILIHEWFEQQVRRTPDACALLVEEQSITYAELNVRANQLAHALIERGVRPNELVAICLGRSIEMVIGLIAILKAGGAYLPLDPDYPAERLQYMLEDARPRVVVTHTQQLDRVSPDPSTVLAIDREWQRISRLSAENPAAAQTGVRPEHLAYVIYTSGSTGKPKGVMVEHRNVTRLFTATSHWFGFDERDVWTLFHSIAFDFSVWELWGALFYGGRVVIVPYAIARSPAEFYRMLCTQQVTVLSQTPSAFAQLSEAQAAETSGRGHSLRVVVFGGEALELRTLRSWIERNGPKRPQLVNMYGITETTVHVTYKPLSEQDIGAERASLIGAPIPDLRVYLLDPRGQPVPIGVPGEMYVGGAGVARGYLNRPELTAERFVERPVGSAPGTTTQRLYKSGDLARWRADGTLEYLGRNDHQVKVRGFRIELGEIEAHIARHALVKDVAVMARDDLGGGKRLVAYVTPVDTADPPRPESLRNELSASLPHYMVPTAFVVLTSFPLTANGKLDRRALPVPELDAYSSQQYQPPENETEQIIADIWSELLNLERVGREDNFFAMGGHSLLAMRVFARLQAVLSTQLPIRLLFEHPTVRGLAEQVARFSGDSAPQLEEDDRNLDEILLSVAEMPDKEVQELLQELSTEESL